MIGYFGDGPKDNNFVTKFCKCLKNIIKSDPRNVTKARHVPKRAMCSKFEFASKQ